jgi:hypothetical protein
MISLKVDSHLMKGRHAHANEIGFKVHDEVFEICLAGTEDPGGEAFAEIHYDGERTLIRAVPEGRDACEGRDYKMVSFIGDLPLEMVGFLSLISEALAKRKIPIFVISSYWTDHLLLPKKDLDEAIDALKSLGMKMQ